MSSYVDLLPKIIKNNPSAVKLNLIRKGYADTAWAVSVSNFIRLVQARTANQSQAQQEAILIELLNVPIMEMGHHGQELYGLSDKGNISAALRRSFGGSTQNGTSSQNFQAFGLSESNWQLVGQGLALFGAFTLLIIGCKLFGKLLKMI